jgi:enoyl-CoA hydratase
MAEYSNLQLDVQDRVATLSINRPDKLNALNEQTIRELGQAMDEITARDDVRGVILTGVGEKGFVAGADIAELAKMGPVDGIDVSRLGQRVFRQIELSRKPVIAAVNGFALGGGCELALACHLRIASENAQFGLPEVKLGIIPGYGGTLRLPRIVGKGRALELMLTAQFIKAEEAYRIGLVNKLVRRPEAVEGQEAPDDGHHHRQRPHRAGAGHRVHHPRDGDVAGRRIGDGKQPFRPARRHRRHARGDDRLPREAESGVHGPVEGKGSR